MSVIDLWSGVVGDSDVVTVLLGGDVMLGRGVRSCPILPNRSYVSRICVMRGDTSGWPSTRTGRFRAPWTGGGPG